MKAGEGEPPPVSSFVELVDMEATISAAVPTSEGLKAAPA